MVTSPAVILIDGSDDHGIVAYGGRAGSFRALVRVLVLVLRIHNLPLVVQVETELVK